MDQLGAKPGNLDIQKAKNVSNTVVKDKPIKRAKCFAIASGISIILGVICLCLSFFILQRPNPLAIASEVLVAGVVPLLATIAFVIWLRNKQLSHLDFISKVSFFLGVMSLFPAVVLKSKFPWIAFWGCSFIVAPVLGILGNLVFLRGKTQRRSFRAVGAILLKLILLITMGRFILPYIYTSPAITSRRLAIYNRYIEFLKDHDQYKTFQLNEFGMVHVEDAFYILDSPNSEKELRKLFSEDDIDEMREISKKLYQINCDRAIRENDMVLFIKYISSAKPKSFGVLYSLYGRNPNEIDNEVLSDNKPFTKIGGNWYMSRHLVREGRRLIPIPIPKQSLIDHSLRTRGLNLGNNNK